MLSQYRNYAGGRGYALEFDTSARLVPNGVLMNAGAWLDVVYGGAEEQRLISALLERVVDRRHHDKEFLDQRLGMILSLAALTMKDEAFESEQEVRAFWLTDMQPAYRPTPAGIVPYLELAHEWDSWKWEPFTNPLPGGDETPSGIGYVKTDLQTSRLDLIRAYVGPPQGLDASRRARTLAELAVDTGSNDFEVLDSGIPYMG